MIYWTRQKPRGQKLTDSYQMLVWLVHRTFARQGRIMGLGVICASRKLHSPVKIQH